MANFVKHTPCSSCGSKDNLAHYDDGSAWCFGCKYYQPPKHAPTNKSKSRELFDNELVHPLPDDVCDEFSQDAWDWLEKYGMKGEDIYRGNVQFSPGWNQIIFPFYDTKGTLLAWQARNLSPKKMKYFTSGELNTILPVYSSPNKDLKDTICLVEDCVSALKISRWMDSMPCLGSGLPLLKLKRLAGLYSRLILWLDGNMFHHSIRMGSQASLLGRSTYPLYTDLDPKEYTDEEIKQYIKKVLDI